MNIIFYRGICDMYQWCFVKCSILILFRCPGVIVLLLKCGNIFRHSLVTNVIVLYVMLLCCAVC